MNNQHAKRIASIMALKTFYHYRENDLVKNRGILLDTTIADDIFYQSVSLLLPQTHSEKNFLELTAILSRTLATLIETDRFGILWNGDKAKIIKGLSQEYYQAIDIYVDNHSHQLSEKENQVKWHRTFRERRDLRVASKEGVEL